MIDLQFYHHSQYHFIRSKPSRDGGLFDIPRLFYFQHVVTLPKSLSNSYHKHCPFPFTSSSNLIPPVHIFILLMVSVTHSPTLQQMYVLSLIYTIIIHHRHLLVACETVLLIVELHGSKLLKHKTGNNVLQYSR